MASKSVTHVCIEVRLNRPARTWCGIRVVQSERGLWHTELRRNRIQVDRPANMKNITCARCWACAD